MLSQIQQANFRYCSFWFCRLFFPEYRYFFYCWWPDSCGVLKPMYYICIDEDPSSVYSLDIKYKVTRKASPRPFSISTNLRALLLSEYHINKSVQARGLFPDLLKSTSLYLSTRKSTWCDKKATICIKLD